VYNFLKLWRKRNVAKSQLPLKSLVGPCAMGKSLPLGGGRVLDLQHHITQHHDLLFTREDDE
jgi:hypothetical protein